MNDDLYPSKVRDLPPWDDDWQEPERPSVHLLVIGARARNVIAGFISDPRSAEWFATWLTTKDAWTAFGNWLDRHR